MADEFLRIAPTEQGEVITAASSSMNMLPVVAEEDVWLCFLLKVQFSIPKRRPSVFEG